MLSKREAALFFVESADRFRESLSIAERLDTDWIALEKIDGLYVSIDVSRSGWSASGKSQTVLLSSGFREAAEGMLSNLIGCLKEKCADEPWIDRVSFQGEFFGRKVWNRVDYGVDVDFRFFGAFSISRGVYRQWSFAEMQSVLEECGLESLSAPLICRFKRPSDALEANPCIASALNPESPAEGIVVQPERVSWMVCGDDGEVRRLLFKMLNPLFPRD